MSFSDKELPYKVIELSLATARTDGAESLENVSNTLTVITLDGGTLSFKLNSSDNDSITASDGLKIEGTVITEIYWTNAAQAGLTAEIFLSWVD
jgi:hypothetical protein